MKFDDKLTGYEAVIKFWGANQAKNDASPSPDQWHSKIKIEVILYEVLLFDQVDKKVMHDYSDQISLDPNAIPSYQIEEILTEKLRSLIHRSYTPPRDYYDIWYLSTTTKDLNWPKIVEAFHAKMKFKNLEFTGIDQFINEDNDKKLKGAWKNSLAHYIVSSKLPEYTEVNNALKKLFKGIFN